MSYTARTQTPPAISDPITQCFWLLLDFGRDLFARIQACVASGDATYLPKRFAANPKAAERRVERALDWIFALSRTLAGKQLYLPLFRRAPPAPALAPNPRLRPYVPLNPNAALMKSLRYGFARRPIGTIVRRICSQLGIRADSDFYPNALIAITETPLAWYLRHQAAPQGQTATPLPAPPVLQIREPNQHAHAAAMPPAPAPTHIRRPPPPD